MTLSVDGTNLNPQEVPNKCPRCHHSISANYKNGAVKDYYCYDLFFHCPNCNRGFIAEYIDSYINELSPLSYKESSFEEEIVEISPDFIDIFNQALAAESQNLNQLTGIGLRKALEFLVKDFLIYKKPGDEENIKKTQLSRCINNYIDDVKLKKIAERAVWLGNDETHYIRKWEDRDIKDLKLLIKVTVNMIHNEILADKYLEEMES